MEPAGIYQDRLGFTCVFPVLFFLPTDYSVGSLQRSVLEVLEGGVTSKEADIFSFARVMIEVRSDGILLIEPFFSSIREDTGIYSSLHINVNT